MQPSAPVNKQALGEPLPDLSLPAIATGEARSLDAVDGRFEDGFKGYEVHLYKLGD